jgi:hypothetical protein
MQLINNILAIIISVYCFQQQYTPHASLVCKLSVEKTTYKIGEIPVIKVAIKNISNKDVYLIGSLDGSEIKRRMPYCYFDIEKPRPDIIQYGFCGTTNPLRASDFVLVRAHSSFNPYQPVDNYGFFTSYMIGDTATFRNPGVYKIQFHYSTMSGNINRYKGMGSSADSVLQKQRFEKVPRVELVSYMIEVVLEK